MSLGTRDSFTGRTPLMIGSLILAGILGRLLPHAPNATPMAALGLVAGAALGGRLAILAPLAALALTDLIIGTYAPAVMAAVYACMALPGVLGATVLKKSRNPLMVALCAALCSTVFFLVTNFAVWAGGGWYEASLAGLVQCYAAALPFARNMMAADLIWSAALFAGLVLLEQAAPVKSAAGAEA